MLLTAFAPAKINLLLAILGTRPDGFHELASLAAPIALGDTLWLEMPATLPEDSLHCDYLGVPTDNTNLVLRAAAVFRKCVPATPPVRFTLQKRIPHGAGLGGGSSDAASTLLLLNEASGRPLSLATLEELAAAIGSDCPMFLHGRPVIMRGRGERIETLLPREHAALRGRRLLLFKPDFSVSTAAAYNAMRNLGAPAYAGATQALAQLATWRASPETEPPLFNNMEGVVFAKHLALPVLIKHLQAKFALSPRMSGSGSACFAFLPTEFDVAPVAKTIREAWGTSAFICETTLL
ncbi:MAG: 4-(cytidine 5'-diphospho)-2-C-methyl-D-erythritol kinase [Puniceicoccales bacterium]|jgi:4-diphosphocytidyl-2-C-methyl-D-erythritol kinase|nr:4-(cytidine 5'-diphospho)-2-C-methyl-D-erythritol kinase [Puniceicoccales bacterium]